MFEDYLMKKNLEFHLENLKPNSVDTPEETLGKNIGWGVTKFFLTKVCDENFIMKYRATILHIMQIFGFEQSQVDYIFTLGFSKGYAYRKSEELAELILTEPYNKFGKN